MWSLWPSSFHDSMTGWPMAFDGKTWQDCECTIPESVLQSQFQLCRCYQTGSTMLLLVIPRNPEKKGGPKRGCYGILHRQQLDDNHNEHRLIMYFVIWPAYGLGLFFGSWESSWRLAMFPLLHTMDDLHHVNPWFHICFFQQTRVFLNICWWHLKALWLYTTFDSECCVVSMFLIAGISALSIVPGHVGGFRGTATAEG